MNRKLRLVILTLAILSATFLALVSESPSPAASATPVYVDDSATGANDGSSWDNAFVDLQVALAAATEGDEIWVAEGLYKPAPAGSRGIAFALKAGVALYGGFAGGEVVVDERDWETHATVLSGDIDGNDTVDARGVITTASHLVGANSYRVVKSDGVTETAILDGFIVTGGYNNAGTNSRGGGIYNLNSSPTLSNLLITGNRADNGAGIYNDYSSPTVTDVVITGNRANFQGGGVCNFYSYARFTDVTFLRNTCTNLAGGAENYQGGPVFVNCTFQGNVAGNAGGMRNYSSDVTIINTLVVGNRGSVAGLYNWYDGPNLVNVTVANNAGQGIYNWEADVTISNSIIWGNTSGQVTNLSSSPVVRYSNIQGGYSGTGNIKVSPEFCVTPDMGNDGAWGTIDDDYGDLHVSMTSPVIDAADNAAVPITITTDMDGEERFVDILEVTDTGSGSAPIVDMGAYEVQAPALALEKIGPVSPVNEGSSFTYTLILRNVGGELIKDAAISDTLPAGLEVAGPIELEPPTAGIIGVLPSLAHDLTLAPGDTITLTLPVRALDGPKTLVNTAVVTSSTLMAPIEATAVITVQNAIPSLIVTGGTRVVKVGEPLNLAVAYEDPGVLDTHTALFAWDDGSETPGIIDTGAHSITASHVYSSYQTYTVTLTLQDSDEAEAAEDIVVVVRPYTLYLPLTVTN